MNKENKRLVRMREIFIPIFVASVIAISALFIIEAEIYKCVEEKNRDIDNYTMCMSQGEMLHFGSETLTSEALLFINGQGAEHAEHYINEQKISTVRRNGMSSLTEYGIDEVALACLVEGNDRSYRLEEREQLAMALVSKSGIYDAQSIPSEISSYPIPAEYEGLSRQELIDTARYLTFGLEYLDEKEKISQSIHDCAVYAEEAYHRSYLSNVRRYNVLRTARYIAYIFIFLVILAFSFFFTRAMYSGISRMVSAIRNDERMKPGRIACFHFLAKSYNAMRDRVTVEMDQIRITNEEYEAVMDKTGVYISTYDVQSSTFIIHDSVAKKLNIPKEYRNMPDDFLAAIATVVDYECFEEIAQICRDIKVGIPTGVVEVEAQTTGNSKEWYRTSYCLIFDESGSPVKAIVTTTLITKEKMKEHFFNEYIMSIENRILSSRGTFIRIDVTYERLIKLVQYTDFELKEHAAENLQELYDNFDKYNFVSNHGETFRQVFAKEALEKQFDLGKHDIITQWHGVLPNGTALNLEMLTTLITNPNSGSMEITIQIYAAENLPFANQKKWKKILLIQAPGDERNDLVSVLAASFDVTTANSCNEGEALLNGCDEYGVVIVDLSSDKGSFDFIRKAKEEFRTLPLVGITNGSSIHETEAMKAGVEDVCVRPIINSSINRRIHNIITKEEALAELQNASDRRDEMTGLLKQGSFVMLANEMIRTSTDDERFAMLCFDVADFKLISLRYGSHKGDEILMSISRVLHHIVDNNGGIAMRARGDRFYAIIPADEASIVAVCDAVNGMDYDLDVKVLVRIGVCVSVSMQDEAENMMDKALLAMDSIRGDKHKNIAVFAEEMLAPLAIRKRIVADFYTALKEGQIMPYFQPKYNYEKKCFAGAEALVRWNHPFLGFIKPSEFIPVIEKEGLIPELDLYILEQVCMLQDKWRSEGLDTPRISVNLSIADFLVSNLAEKTLEILERYNMTGDEIRFEITETAYINSYNSIMTFISILSEKGFLFDMDDFGSGYSSLNMLGELNIDGLKLDMCMTQNSNHGNKGRHIIGAVIRMAGWLDLQVLAEGIENETQAEYLYGLGCIYMQGYYFSQPLPADEYRENILINSECQTQKSRDNLVDYNDQSSVTLSNPISIEAADIIPLLRAIGIMFPLVICQNYTQNTYYIVEYSSFETKAARNQGKYTELIAVGASTFHPDDSKSFTEMFDINNVLEAWKNGQTKLTHIGRQLSDDGVYHWIKTQVIMYTDDKGDIKGYTLAKNVDDQFENLEI